jgi:hypothetical protein
MIIAFCKRATAKQLDRPCPSLPRPNTDITSRLRAGIVLSSHLSRSHVIHHVFAIAPIVTAFEHARGAIVKDRLSQDRLSFSMLR